MPFQTYVLVSDEFYHYTGHTLDLNLRLECHAQKTTHFTKKGTNWKIIYSKEFSTRSDAIRHEKWLKSGVGRDWLKKHIAGWSPPKAE